MKEDYARSEDGIDIHHLENEYFDPALTPLVIVPGMMGIAEHYLAGVEAMSPRRTIALTHRGLGKSGKIQPGAGSFAHRCSDIKTVTSHLDLPRYFLYGFSRGVSMAVAHALEHPDKVVGLILHDCEPTYSTISEKWRDNLISANRPHIPSETVMAYWKDSEAVDLTARLSQIACPTLLFRGEQEGSLLPLERAEKMKSLLRSAKIVALPNSSHELSPEDMSLFVETLRVFTAGTSL